MSTTDCANGNYRFLPGIAPFSSGAVAMPGWQVVHATLRRPMPWRKGFELIDTHLAEEKRPRAALCAVELRIPTALTPAGFDGFNAGYQALLKEWDLLVDGQNPIARTNVAPVVGPPGEASLYGFGYTAPGGPPKRSCRGGSNRSGQSGARPLRSGARYPNARKSSGTKAPTTTPNANIVLLSVASWRNGNSRPRISHSPVTNC